MTKKCVLCNEKVEEEFGKLMGTMLRLKDENGKRQFTHVCSTCQKQDKWIEDAKIKSV